MKDYIHFKRLAQCRTHSSLLQEKNSATALTHLCQLPVGNTWMVVWEGPLVGTPGCCTGLGCKGGKGCRGRVKGWVGMLSPVTGAWLWFCFCFLPSALKQTEDTDNSKQNFSFLHHSFKRHSVLQSFLPFPIYRLVRIFQAWHFSDLSCLRKQICRELIQFSSLSSLQSPLPRHTLQCFILLPWSLHISEQCGNPNSMEHCAKAFENFD